MDNDTLILFGGEVKAKTEGIVEGYLILFGDDVKTDLSKKRDFFTSDTDFDLDVSDRKRVCYQHGFDIKIDNRKLGIGQCKIDDVGVWIEAQLKMRDEYEKAVYELASNGKLGWSSGATSHLVRREKQDNGSNKILAWPIGEASLTPNPAEPRTLANVKSLLGETEPENYPEFDIKTLDDIEDERGYEKWLRRIVGQEAAIALTSIAKHNFKSKSLRNREEEEARTAAAEADKAREERLRVLERRHRTLDLYRRGESVTP